MGRSTHTASLNAVGRSNKASRILGEGTTYQERTVFSMTSRGGGSGIEKEEPERAERGGGGR